MPAQIAQRACLIFTLTAMKTVVGCAMAPGGVAIILNHANLREVN